MAKGQLKATVDRRERARKKAKRFGGFLKEATAGLLKSRRHMEGLNQGLEKAGRERDHHHAEIKQLREARADAVAEKKTKLAAELDAKLKRHMTLRDRATTHIENKTAALEKELANRKDLKFRAKRAATKRRFWRKRFTGAIRKIRHIRELREMRRNGQPEFQSWMANGADYHDASEGARAFIARAVVLHGLTCTSMARTYVPAGGSTSSYHLVWNGGRAGDAAGSLEAMQECQRAEYERGLGLAGQLEMFGPINDRCLKYGSHLTLAEGDPLENLHDSHCHLAEEDSAVAAASG